MRSRAMKVAGVVVLAGPPLASAERRESGTRGTRA